MNTYLIAILKATSNGAFPEYSDLWRSYHVTAMMLDSDYCLFDKKNGQLSPIVQEHGRTGRKGVLLGDSSLLKVSVTFRDDSKSSNLHLGSNQK